MLNFANYDLDAMLASYEALDDVPVISGGRKGCGAYSFGIVNSRNNGKRLTISKALAAALELTDYVEFAPVPKEGVLIIGKKLPVKNASDGNLTGEDKKICYFSQMVQTLTKLFGLDFSKHTSMSFSDIEVEDRDEGPIAIIRIENKYDETEDGESA